ncbi:MAG: oxygen-independent coproporphyrinogen III oxidase [Cyclobacteriaceae bacterium]|nr:oxygen-independent coproporphyrinogen III oxidase [Cyclobacteriaceae bacterium]
MKELIKKYNVPAPRYTSYPTVPFWDVDQFNTDTYLQSVVRSVKESNEQQGISLYIHLPYCESLCTFCGCNKRITKNHDVEGPYITALLKEWKMYTELMGERPVIQEIHLGGGTPTFFSPENIKNLISGILDGARVLPQAEFGFEGHPNNTSREHLETLAKLGFSRVSFGIQDTSTAIQKVINRLQPWENVERAVNWARELNYSSINFDLVYGLPFQHKENIEETIGKTLELRPERIAFYSYAHVPWIKGLGQRKFTEADLPKDQEKRALYELGCEKLREAGYVEIGMDHFSLEEDSLFKAWRNNTLHRNFMGYTSGKTQLMVGLGVSSISDSWYGFAQNEKKVEDYLERVDRGEIPIFRGHILTAEDLFIRKKILEIMCFGETSITDKEMGERGSTIRERLLPLQQDGLVQLGEKVKVTEQGRTFLRNICMAFDARLWRTSPDQQMFSMSV